MENNEADIQTPEVAFTKPTSMGHLGEKIHLHVEHARDYIQEHWAGSRSHRVRFSHFVHDSRFANAMMSLVAGGVAGACSRTLVAPFERLKIMFQVQGNPPVYTSVGQGLRKIYAEEGLRGFFKGNGVNVIRIFPTSAIQYFSFDNYKRMYSAKVLAAESRKDLTVFERLILGGLAGITALIATYPLEMVRGRLTIQTAQPKYTGLKHALVTVTQEEGVRALYKGLLPSVVGVVPYVGIDFAVFETLKQSLRDYKAARGESTVIGPQEIFVAGGIAAVFAQTFAYPLDVIRRRLQIQGFQTSLIKHDRHYDGMFDAARKIWTGEGFKGFYRGSAANYLKVIPMQATSFLIYDTLKKRFNF